MPKYSSKKTSSKKTSSKKTSGRTSSKKTRKNITYNKTDFISGDGMLTTIWGPSLWHTLHVISFNYPNNPTTSEKKHYRQFILQLEYILPCIHCRTNLKKNFKSLPLKLCDMKNRYTFSLYVYKLHELVNNMLCKSSGLSYCKVRERYEHFRSRCTDEKPKLYSFRKTLKKKEKGCTEPLYGKKAKCIIKIVPQEEKCATFQMDEKCIKKRE